MLRKIAAAVVMVPLAVILVAFAVANRQDVRISFDPFDPTQPAYSFGTWLFVPIFAALIFGVLIGGLASSLRQCKWRGAARRFERELNQMRGKVAAVEGRATEPPSAAAEVNPPLKLRPPGG